MKVLFVSGNLSDGGAQRVISVVASSMAEKGHDVFLLLFKRSEKEYPLSGKVKIISLAKDAVSYDRISILERMRTIRGHIKQIKPDVSVGFLEGGWGLYVSSIGMKLTTVASARIDPKYIFRKTGLRGMINRMWFKHADAIVLQTISQIESVPESLRKRCAVIANPISDAIAASEYHSYQQCSKFVMVGRLNAQKNYRMAIDALAEVAKTAPEAALDIYGKGSEEQQLLDYIAEKGLEQRVHLKGWADDIPKIYQSYDAYLMTSDFEGMPNALMEAMGIGLPCISTDCKTGPSDLIDDGRNGMLVPVGDVGSLRDRMLALMRMPEQDRAQMGQSARQTILTRYQSSMIAEEWMQLFIGLCTKG